MKKNKDKLSFSLTLKTKSVELDDAEYTLKELTGAQRDDHMDSMRDRMDFSEKGETPRLKSFKGLQAGFLSLCLFDSKDKAVEQDVILSWPASVQGELYKIAQDLSGMNEVPAKNEEQAKND